MSYQEKRADKAGDKLVDNDYSLSFSRIIGKLEIAFLAMDEPKELPESQIMAIDEIIQGAIKELKEINTYLYGDNGVLMGAQT